MPALSNATIKTGEFVQVLEHLPADGIGIECIVRITVRIDQDQLTLLVEGQVLYEPVEASGMRILDVDRKTGGRAQAMPLKNSDSEISPEMQVALARMPDRRFLW